jgi:hypothetical protein
LTFTFATTRVVRVAASKHVSSTDRATLARFGVFIHATVTIAKTIARDYLFTNCATPVIIEFLTVTLCKMLITERAILAGAVFFGVFFAFAPITRNAYAVCV